jgi:hypothetical protein
MILKTETVPTFITVAIFTAILIQDLAKADYKYMLGHFLFGVIAVLLMLYLTDSGATYVAYGVLVLPFVLLLVGWSIDSVKKVSGETVPAPSPSLLPPPTPRAPCGCGRCRSCPCICVFKDASGSAILPAAENHAPSSGSLGNGTESGAGGNGDAPKKPTKTELCGPGSASGKTQCVDVSTLTQV